MQTKNRKYSLNKTNPAPSTGEMLENYIKDKRIYQSALSRMLNRHTSGIAAFRKRPTLQTAILWEFCHALQHNFFADIAAQLPESYTQAANSVEKTETVEVADLQAEIAALKIERDVLQGLLDRWMRGAGKV